MENSKGFIIRVVSLLLVVVALFTVFTVRLIQLQLIQGDEYLEQADRKTMRTTKVEAARGEITDRYGRPLAVNRMGYQIILDKAFVQPGQENDVVLRITDILQKASEPWVDTFPILYVNNALVFAEEREKDVKKLQEFVSLNIYATADNCFDALVEKYGLQDYSLETGRNLAAIRYQMDNSDWTLTNPYVFADDVSMETVTKVKEQGIYGVDASTVPIREYTNPNIAPHLIGTMGPIYAEEYATLKEQGYSMNDEKGKSGIELAMESYLRGKNGVKAIEQDSKGVVTEVYERVAPTPGNTVVLTLDSRLQEIAQNSLAANIKKFADQAKAKNQKGWDANAGAVVVSELATGGILAQATFPTYDRDTYKNDYESLKNNPDTPLLDRTLMGTYEPGSTVKPIMAIAGLQEGKITTTSTITCNKVYTYFRDNNMGDYAPKCLGTHGTINVYTAVAKSCNVFFYETARRLGIDAMNRYWAMVGLGQSTGIELPEYKGTLAGPETMRTKGGRDWRPGDVVQAGIGQSINLFTPMQMVSYVSTIANGGQRHKMHLVKTVSSYDNASTVKAEDTEVLSTIEASEANIKTAQKAMYDVTHGGGSNAQFAGYQYVVAGKTGTAQVPNGSDNSLFICYAPYDNPQIAISVIIEHAANSNATTAIAKDIMNAYFNTEVYSPAATPEGVILP